MKTINTTLLIFLTLASLHNWQCRKNDLVTTTITGRVYDRVTGEPIEGAYLNFNVYGSQDESIGVVIKEYNVTTGIDGIYRVIHIGDEDERMHHWLTHKTGYMPMLLVSGEKQGVENNIDYGLTPQDAKLSLKINHTTSDQNVLYVKCYNDAYKDQAGVNPVSYSGYFLKIDLPMNQTLDTSVYLPGNWTTHVLWDSLQKTSIVAQDYLHQDSLWLPRSGTEMYSIVY
ncbi:MAG: hypothetical protein IT269_09995 [Saprospiraceae bacterium]|nr:hypothetical protein [Saprospiraceae bacterium]